MTQAHDQDVGGIRCMQVLELLADYIDDDASAEDRRRIEAHLQGCRWCERFGGAYAQTVASLRSTLKAQAPTPDFVGRLEGIIFPES